MPIILRTERRHIRTRLLVFAMYAFLALGGLSMVYPFLLLVSGSTKSSVDVFDFDLFPRYLHDDTMLFRKYVEEKCNEQFRDYADNYAAVASNFRDLQPPAPCAPALLADWRQFNALPMPSGFYALGGSVSRNGQNVPGNLRAFRAHMRRLCGGDIERLRRTYDVNAGTWLSLTLPYEMLSDRYYQRAAAPFMEEFYRFKEGRPPQDRIYLSCDRAFGQSVELSGKYNRRIDDYNTQNATALKSFAELALTARRPTGPGAAADWESFVREMLNPAFVTADEAARPGYAAFLAKQYGSIASLNRLYQATPGTNGFSRFEDVPFPSDRARTSAALTDYMSYLKDRELLSGEHLRVDTPEIRWRAFLQEKYGAAAAAGRSHGRPYVDISEVRLPQGEADYAYCREHGGTLRLHFLRRNFAMVLDYVLLYGRGIRNTIIYCLLSILAALCVNPMAAYALSRYNLRGQYKILLFLIATMSFPPVVTMIPNFLILKELNLLNTFAALILPGMANGYSIFLLKGFFDGLPRELYEAADIDGATEWHKFWIVTMALSKPILAVVALGAFVSAYSNFMMAFILCQDERMWTLMVWLFNLQSFAGQGVVFASLLVAAVPTLIMFLFCQNLIIRGIVVPTEK
jgi:ABC-type glycerol-3-phosphate transport system permease component